VEQFEMSAVQSLERQKENNKRAKKRRIRKDGDTNDTEDPLFEFIVEDRDTAGESDVDMENGEMDEEEELRNLSEEDFQEMYSDTDPRYKKKLEQSYNQARLAPYEREMFPYLISHTCFPKHTLIKIPIMLDSSLCHVLDDISRMMNDIYCTGKERISFNEITFRYKMKFSLTLFSAFVFVCIFLKNTIGGGFIFKGKRRPIMRTNKCRFSANFMFDKDVENRSAHPTRALRNSSSTLTCCMPKQQQHKFKNQFMEWKIPYCYDFKVPWYVLFAGCGLLDKTEIENLVMYEIRHYFRKWKDIPMDKVRELIQNSLEHNARESEKIKTQEEAWIYIGKLTEKSDDVEFAMDLIAAPEEEKKVPKVSKRKRKAATLNAIAEASNPDRETNEEEGKNVVPEPIVFKPYMNKDPNKDLMRIGRQTICKEILPHVGCDIRKDAQFWRSKVKYYFHYHSILFSLCKTQFFFSNH
jgi:DNA-directed RNA polymerase beta subunit